MRGGAGGLPFAFIQAIDTALQQFADDPERWPLDDNRHRWVKTKKFPYLLV